MTDYDIAIFGTNPLANLLAGLLARDHGKSVVRVGRRPSAQRLPRSVELALPLSTRPSSWQLLRNAAAEARQLVAATGGGLVWSASEVGVVADTEATSAALDHVLHLAAGFDHQVARLANGFAVRGVPLLLPEASGAAFEAWLTGLGVVLREEGPVDAAQAVFADEAAALDLLTDAQRPPLLLARSMTATLIAAPRPPAWPVMLFPDRGVTLLRRPGNSVLALVSGDDEVDERLASTLTGPFPMKRLAATRYRRLIPIDGAPVISPIGNAAAMLLAGLGTVGAFLAPALARLIVGKATPEEQAFFDAHAPDAARETVADLQTAAPA